MSFTELAFAWFLPIVLGGYYLLGQSLRLQNIWILATSLFFYAWWDPRFLALMILSMASTYIVGLKLETTRYPQLTLGLGIAVLLGFLGFFKYANFFIESFSTLLRAVGLRSNSPVLDIILPIGISFYTFQKIAYLVDIYRRQIPAERNIIDFGAFATFFPQLVAGPIERASDLLQQFKRSRHVSTEQLSKAVWLIVLGYFFKLGIADVLSPSVELAFSPPQPSGWWTLFGTYAFGLQIYCDFLGYSLIAKGLALLFGIELTWNFAFPYWATSLVEFWRRWHISLSHWLRDYLYIPLGGGRGSRLQTTRNLLLTMALGGLWHGASFTFIIWGVLHGIALAINHALPVRTPTTSVGKVVGWVMTMIVVFVGWFFFRVQSMGQALTMVQSFRNMDWFPAHYQLVMMLTTMTIIIVALELPQIVYGRYFLVETRLSPWLRSAVGACLLFYTAVVSQHADTRFIYFQF